MPVLANPRHEAVAQGLAEGKTQVDVFAEHGYGRKSNVLIRHPEIKQRVLEIRNDADWRNGKIMNSAMERAGVSKAYVLGRLHEIVERCMQHYPVLDSDGKQVFVETPDGKLAPAFTFDAKNAKGALHLLGLEVGMFAHRVRLDASPLDGLPANVLQEMMENLIALKQGRILEHDASPKLPDQSARVDSSTSG